MTTGTKSVLFGVHCIFWHPITVARAWRDLYGRWPNSVAKWLAVIFHDIGYWGSPNIDGWAGREHPTWSVRFIWRLGLPLAIRSQTSWLIWGHSRHYAEKYYISPSKLYAPDKLAVLFDPPWFYLLRAKLSGEIWEYMRNAPAEASRCPEAWLYWYRAKVRKEFDIE